MRIWTSVLRTCVLLLCTIIYCIKGSSNCAVRRGPLTLAGPALCHPAAGQYCTVSHGAPLPQLQLHFASRRVFLRAPVRRITALSLNVSVVVPDSGSYVVSADEVRGHGLTVTPGRAKKGVRRPLAEPFDVGLAASVRLGPQTPLCEGSGSHGFWFQVGNHSDSFAQNVAVLFSKGWTWVSVRPLCRHHLYTPAEVRSCLNRRHLVFIGDSTLKETVVDVVTFFLGLGPDSYSKLYELLWLPRVYVTRLPKLEQKRDLKRFQLHFGAGLVTVLMQHSRRFTVMVRAGAQETSLSYMYPWPGRGYLKHDRHWSQQAFDDPHFMMRLRDFWRGDSKPSHIIASYGLHEKAMNWTRYAEGVRALLEFHRREAATAGTRLIWREVLPTSDAALWEPGGSDASLEDMNRRANRVVRVYARGSARVSIAPVFRLAWSLYRDAHEVSDGVHYGAKRVGKGRADSGGLQRCAGPAARLPCGHAYRGHVSRMASQLVLDHVCPARDG
eukprot:EG_transcript_10129